MGKYQQDQTNYQQTPNSQQPKEGRLAPEALIGNEMKYQLHRFREWRDAVESGGKPLFDEIDPLGDLEGVMQRAEEKDPESRIALSLLGDGSYQNQRPEVLVGRGRS